MPPPPLNVRADQPPKASASARGDHELHMHGASKQPQNIQSNGQTNMTQEKKKEERSPTSPRNIKSFFNKNSKPERPERAPTPRRDGSTSNLSASDMGKVSVVSQIYTSGSNNSTPSMSQSTMHDDTASMKSTVSGVPESVRSDDEVYRLKSGSTTNMGEHVAQRKGSKGTLPNMLQRSQSKRQNESQDRTPRTKPENPTIDVRRAEREGHSGVNPLTAPPARRGVTLREALQEPPPRNRSADRSAVESEDEAHQQHLRPGHSQNTFFTQFRSHGAKAADGIGKASRGWFGKLKEGRSGSSHEKEGSSSFDPSAQGPLTTLIEPLKEQTRKTRIKKTMDAARDKTEFWMPALPYRCIDYLNHHGIESVGLYRIPGSAAEIKHYQQKFNRYPYDVDMLSPEGEPQDLNVAASLLKAWVRDLPEQLLPKDVQDKIERDAPNETSTPQLMRDELSKLPAYNYYLLFAITCHMSLLHAHREVNKMSYGALRTCWASLNVSAYVFQFLICDWRNCWQGCWTEQEQMLVEQEIIEGGRPPSPTDPARLNTGIMHSQQAVFQQPAAVANGQDQAATRFANARSPERPQRPEQVDRSEGMQRPPQRPPERPERSAPSAPPNSAHSNQSSSQPNPFAQDLGGKSKSSSSGTNNSKKPSTPPSVGQIQQVSPIRM